jgi:hypothetical protein
MTDKMYGTRSAMLKEYSNDSGDSLVVKCYRNHLDIMYGVWSGADINEAHTVPVLVKQDGGKPRREYWGWTADGWYFSPSHAEFAHQLSTDQHLVLEYQDALGNSHTDEFDLNGLSELLPKVTSACSRVQVMRTGVQRPKQGGKAKAEAELPIAQLGTRSYR